MATTISTANGPVLPALSSRLVAVLAGLLGLPLLAAGVWLVTLGGSVFYAVYGLALAVIAMLLWRRRRCGAWALVLLALPTLAWALWEAGLDGWALLPRVWPGLLLAGLAGLLLLPNFKARLGLLAGALVLLGGFVGVLSTRSMAIEPGRNGTFASAAPTLDDGEWPVIGRNNAADRFSPLTQITPENVSKLQVAWRVNLGDADGSDAVEAEMEATPLKIGDRLFLCDNRGRIVALDPDTGERLWRYSPREVRAPSLQKFCRGVTYFAQPDGQGPCAERIIAPTRYATMVAVDARTGQACSDFGHNGEVDLTEGMGEMEPGHYSLTSPPTLVRGNLVVGGFVMDGVKTGLPSGVIRAFDAVTGQLAWAWDMGRPGQTGLPPAGETYTPGSPNAWAPMTADEQLGLVYVPTGNAGPDYVSAHRTDAFNRYSTSTVALDAETGAVRWSYQQIHRDVWDLDNPAPPTLFDLPTEAGPVPALVQPTKSSQFFVLDRRTGKPLVETVEKPVPASAVPGENLSPTQPYPVGMPSFSGPLLTEADMWGISPLDQLWCRIRFRQARYEGEYTPLGFQPAITMPGFHGGSEWGGVGIDRDRDIMIVNVSHFATYNRLVTRAEAEKLEGTPQSFRFLLMKQLGTPYAAVVSTFVSPLNVPCTEPPYGEIAAIDLKTRKVMWRAPSGTARDSGPMGISSHLPITMGVPNLGGVLVTRTGLTFMGATQEKAIRAYDTRSGAVLWHARLPAGGHSNPMTYTSNKTGRQYVVIGASGNFLMASGKSDAIIAYALPAENARTD